MVYFLFFYALEHINFIPRDVFVYFLKELIVPGVKFFVVSGVTGKNRDGLGLSVLQILSLAFAPEI